MLRGLPILPRGESTYLSVSRYYDAVFTVFLGIALLLENILFSSPAALATTA